MSLKYISAYALCSIKNPSPSKDDVAKIVKLGGAFDQSELDAFWTSFEGKSFASAVAEGQSKMTAASAGGGGGAAPAAAAAAAPAPGAKPAAAAKAPEPEESEGEMMDLF